MERSADHAVGIHGRAAELARIGRFLDEAAGVSGGLSNPARNTVKLTQPGRPHTVAGPLHRSRHRPIRPLADTWAP